MKINNKRAKFFSNYLSTLLIANNSQNLIQNIKINRINKSFSKRYFAYFNNKSKSEFCSPIFYQNITLEKRSFTSTENSFNNYFHKNYSLSRLQKNNFSTYYNSSNSKSNYDFDKINQKLNSEILFQIFEKCDLDPKSEGLDLRLKVCPLCEKPHNYDKSNMNTCCINTENMLFNCFRCGSKGHVIRIIKFLRKKFNLDLINEILDTANFSSTENEDSGKRLKGGSSFLNKFGDYKGNDINKDNGANGYSDFSDLEFYKVNKGKRTNSNEGSMHNDYEFIDSDAYVDGNNVKSIPTFSPLLKKSENNISKKNMNNTKNPFTVSYSNNNNNNNNDKFNKNIINNDAKFSNNIFNKSSDNENFNNAEKKNFKFINSKSTSNEHLNDNNYQNNTSPDNKAKLSISPISSISGAPLNTYLKNSSFKISISNINLINQMFNRINLLQEEKHLIVKDYLINERKLSEEVLKFYKIGASFEKFKNTDFDFITLPTVTFPMFYPTDNASYLAVDKSNLRDEVYESLNCDKFFLSRTKVRAIGKEFKHFMRIEPPGAVIW